MNLKTLNQKLQSLNVLTIASETLSEHTGEMADELRSQLYAGRDNLDQSLRQYRSSEYAQMKHGMNPLPGLGNPDLYLTGATHRSIRMAVNGQMVVTLVTDIHDLEKRYSHGSINPFLLGSISKKKLKQTYLQKSSITKVKQHLK